MKHLDVTCFVWQIFSVRFPYLVGRWFRCWLVLGHSWWTMFWWSASDSSQTIWTGFTSWECCSQWPGDINTVVGYVSWLLGGRCWPWERSSRTEQLCELWSASCMLKLIRVRECWVKVTAIPQPMSVGSVSRYNVGIHMSCGFAKHTSTPDS